MKSLFYFCHHSIGRVRSPPNTPWIQHKWIIWIVSEVFHKVHQFKLLLVLTPVVLKRQLVFFINFKLEFLAQFPASNEVNYFFQIQLLTAGANYISFFYWHIEYQLLKMFKGPLGMT